MSMPLFGDEICEHCGNHSDLSWPIVRPFITLKEADALMMKLGNATAQELDRIIIDAIKK